MEIGGGKWQGINLFWHKAKALIVVENELSERDMKPSPAVNSLQLVQCE